MKISVLTPTYNRAKFLQRLYDSLIENSKYGIDIEWLIMDDGSTDETKQYVEKMPKQSIEIKYYYQENQGKMTAINNLVEKATGDLIVDCDSDDYFTSNAFKIIKNTYEQNIGKLENVYALCFLKNDTKGNNMGNNFKNKKTTMFDLYFKEGENGEKAPVFIADIRKKYKHKLEHNEKFVTEARMYHEMDLNYSMICVNEPIMVCEYQDNGYTKNIMEQFKKYPFGYYEYFKEIFKHGMKGTLTNKKIYAIKHLLFFWFLTLVKKLVTKQNILYIIFGVITTIINIGISTVLFKYCNIEGNVASLIGIVAAILFAYFSNRKMVFDSKAKNLKENLIEFFKFILGRIVTMIIEVAGVYILFSIFKFDYILTKILMTIVIIVINYIISKKFAFKNTEA